MNARVAWRTRAIEMLPSEYPEVGPYPQLKGMLERHVDMQFVDLRAILRLPLGELEGGCNYAATAILCNIIGGTSKCFYKADIQSFDKDKSNSGKKFKQLLCDFYSWQDEPLAKCQAVELIYKYTRNPLVHAFGLDAARLRDPIIYLEKRPLTREEIAVLEEEERRPDFLSGTVYEHSDARGRSEYVISVHTLYWGTHRMLRALFADPREARAAEALASELHSREEGRGRQPLD